MLRWTLELQNISTRGGRAVDSPILDSRRVVVAKILHVADTPRPHHRIL